MLSLQVGTPSVMNPKTTCCFNPGPRVDPDVLARLEAALARACEEIRMGSLKIDQALAVRGWR